MTDATTTPAPPAGMAARDATRHDTRDATGAARATRATRDQPLLEVRDLVVMYGEAHAVDGVSLALPEHHALAVLGANGAGKSSLAAAVAGLVRPAAGSVRFAGEDITGWPAHRIARAGLVFVPEGRGIFPHLTVQDNMRAMLHHDVARAERTAAVERAFTIFPVLAQRRRQHAGTLSGGEQQMLALARVLATTPRLLVADEMSLGLAPKLVDLVFESLRRARDEGVSILLIEQYVERALAFADGALVLRRGRVTWSGAAADAHHEALAGYLGEDAGPA